MPSMIGKEDLRSVKTEKALDHAMQSLLRLRNFRKITVKDICDEALISRATFYAHFSDKYDFLKEWLICFKTETMFSDTSYQAIEGSLNQFVRSNEMIIKNLIYSADEETLDILFDFVLSTLNLEIDKVIDGKTNPQYIVFHSFYAGGILNYFSWQTKNNFPSQVPPMNIYFFDVLEMFHDLKNKSH